MNSHTVTKLTRNAEEVAYVVQTPMNTATFYSAQDAADYIGIFYPGKTFEWKVRDSALERDFDAITAERAAHTETAKLLYETTDERDAAIAELEQWRQGPVTEEMLRKTNGCIHVGNDCEIAFRGTTAERDALKTKLNKSAEDWAMCGMPHDSVQAKLAVKLDECRRLTAERDAAIAEQNRLNEYYENEAIELRKSRSERDAALDALRLCRDALNKWRHWMTVKPAKLDIPTHIQMQTPTPPSPLPTNSYD